MAKIKFNSFVPKTVAPMAFIISHGDFALHSVLTLSGQSIVLSLGKSPWQIGACHGKHPAIDTESIECALVEALGSIDAKELEKLVNSVNNKIEKYYDKQLSRMGLALFNRNAKFSDLKVQSNAMLEKLYTGESIDKYWKLVAKPEHFVFGDDAMQVNPASVLTLKKEAPATEAPATEAPATEAPATEAPATEAPATEAPATEAPATEAPATEAPATEAPAEIIPTSRSEIEDIKTYLRSKGIKFPSRANKTELLSLI